MLAAGCAARGRRAAGLVRDLDAATTSTDGDPAAYLKRQLVNIAIGVVLGVMVAATDHRWVRILAPLVYVASVLGLVLVLVMGSTINGSRSWIQVGGMSVQPAEFAKLAVVIGMALLVAERTEGALSTTARWEVGAFDVVGMLADRRACPPR